MKTLFGKPIIITDDLPQAMIDDMYFRIEHLDSLDLLSKVPCKVTSIYVNETTKTGQTRKKAPR